MSNVIDLHTKTPHVTASTTCYSCWHKWQPVVPIGVCSLECPACSILTGFFLPDDAVWLCACGSTHFYITPIGPRCVDCGETYSNE